MRPMADVAVLLPDATCRAPARQARDTIRDSPADTTRAAYTVNADPTAPVSITLRLND